MTPQQKAALEVLLGGPMSPEQEAEVSPLVDARLDANVSEALSIGRTRIESVLITTRAVRAIEAVLPRARHALLTVLRDAASTTPAWLDPTLTALGIPADDHPAIADDLASAWAALNSFTDGGGLDVGSGAARGMLDIIAAAVPASADACVAVKALAEISNPLSVQDVSKVLNNG